MYLSPSWGMIVLRRFGPAYNHALARFAYFISNNYMSFT